MSWMLLVLLYGILKGSREIAKKLAMNKNSVMEVLVVYTVLSFIFVIPQAPKAGGMEGKFYIYIAIKSFCIFVAWIFSFRSLKKLPVSLYGILDLSRVLFATFIGVVLLGEQLNTFRIIGILIVCSGLLLLKFKPPFLKKLFKIDESTSLSNEIKTTSQSELTGEKVYPMWIYIVLAIVSCMLNAVSSYFDKVLMKDLTSSQLQFWYMLFLVAYYLIYILITREKIHLSVLKNVWVWALAVMFVIGDKALFIANAMEGSKITMMTLIKQSACIVTIAGGKFIFKEKNTAYRFFCAAIIIVGIVLGVIK